MKKSVLVLISLLIMALVPMTAYADDPADGRFLCEPVDYDEAKNGQDVEETVLNAPYIKDSVTYDLIKYEVYKQTEDSLGNLEWVLAKDYPDPNTLKLSTAEGAPAGSRIVTVPYDASYADKGVNFKITAVFEHPTDPSAEHVNIDSDEFAIVWHTEKILKSITVTPSAKTMPSGTEKSNEAFGIDKITTARLTFTDNHDANAQITAWDDIASKDYDPTSLEEQHFNVVGDVYIPAWVDTAAIPATVVIEVTVSKADTVATPSAAPLPGTYPIQQTVSLSCATEGAEIYYTTDNTDPKTSTTRTKYTAPFTLMPDPTEAQDVTYTIRAVGVKKQHYDSAEFSGVYVIQKPPKYTVTVTNDGNGTASANITEAKVGTEITLTATPKTGYKFNQWVSTGTPVTITNNKFSMPAGAVNLNATFTQRAQYTVKFNTQYGPSIPEQKVYEGEKAKKPSNPSYSGYTFRGYYTDSSFSKEFDFNTAITANTNIYLKWEKTEYFTVTFAMNGHGNPISPIKVEKNKKLNRPSNPSAQGYSFEGWYRDSACNDSYDFDDKVTKDFTLYAKWSSTTNNGNNNYTPYNSNTRSTSMGNIYPGTFALPANFLPNAYAMQSQVPFVYQQILPEGTIMCSLGGSEPVIDMKVYGTDPKNVINQQLLANMFMNTLYDMDAACYKTVDLYPTVSVKGGPNDGSPQMLRWRGTNYPAGAVFGVVWTYWDKAYIIPGVCDTNGTITLSNFRLRPESTLTIVVPMQKVSTEVATKAQSASPNGVTQVETTTTTTTTTTEEAKPVSSAPATTSTTLKSTTISTQ